VDDPQIMNPDHPFWRRIDWLGTACLGVLLVAAVLLPLLPDQGARHERFVLTGFGIGVYMGTFLIASLLFAGAVRERHNSSYSDGFRRVCRWVVRWHGLVLMGLSAGAVAGGVLYLTGGILLKMEGSAVWFLLNGIRDGTWYLLVWTPGAALVICFMQAFGPYKNKDSTTRSRHKEENPRSPAV